MLKCELVRGIVISNTCVKLYRNWIINEVARAGEHTNERTYVLTYIRTGQTLYPLHNFVVRGDNNPKSAAKECFPRDSRISLKQPWQKSLQCSSHQSSTVCDISDVV